LQHRNVIPALCAIVASARTIRKEGWCGRIWSNHMSCAPLAMALASFGALVTSDGSVLSFPYAAEGDQASSMLPPRADEVIE
jgi:hypothetical protein